MACLDWIESIGISKLIEEELLLSFDEEFDFENEISAYQSPWIHSVRLYDAPAVPVNPFLPFAKDSFLSDTMRDDDIMLEKVHKKDEEDLFILSSSLINPRTYEKVSVEAFSKNDKLVEPCEESKAYRAWMHDHDYFEKMKTGSTEENGTTKSTKVLKSENEPIVEVWKIDSFSKDHQTADSDQWSENQPKVRGRRLSTRNAKMKHTEQARKISNALLHVSNDKPKRTRQYKNVRPKNSVETTPSQSDIEEWSSVPVKSQKFQRRQNSLTKTKVTKKLQVTKKKTTKGRIDHSESERHRREVLRENFAALCELVPMKYLRGEKASSQISKQKILTGAKTFMGVLKTCKVTYKHNLVKNKDLCSRWQDRKQRRRKVEALRKCMKKK